MAAINAPIGFRAYVAMICRLSSYHVYLHMAHVARRRLTDEGNPWIAMLTSEDIL